MFTVFGFFAGYSGYLIWHVFLGVDSYEFPARNYGDLSFRTWGTITRYITNIMQALGLLLLLGQVVIQYGENISAVSKFKLCYAVCPVIFVCVGLFLSQIRTLRSYGILANFAIWLNLLVIFITMGVIAHSPPNFAVSVLGSAGSAVDPTTITPDSAGNYPPVMHYSKLPASGLIGSINGLLSGVLAYAGAQLFVEFLAEMRRPRDFLKAMWGAQLFIYSVYLIYGCFVYHFQGQYSFNPSYQGVSSYAWQTVGNMISLVAALIAAGLYGNIGIKVLYNNILLDIFHAPPLITTRGKILYAAIVPVWWSIAFIIAAAIPDYFGFVSVISASMLLNLTYTIPPLIALGFDIQKNAMREVNGEGFNPITGEIIRNETDTQRWVRGFFSGGSFQVAKNVWHVIYFLASLSMCGLGMYAAIVGKCDQTLCLACNVLILHRRYDRCVQEGPVEFFLLSLTSELERVGGIICTGKDWPRLLCNLTCWITHQYKDLKVSSTQHSRDSQILISTPDFHRDNAICYINPPKQHGREVLEGQSRLVMTAR